MSDVGLSYPASGTLVVAAPEAAPVTLQNLQMLRFAAAAAVVMAHLGFGMYGVSAQVTDLGGIGVDVFFVISGFIMPFIAFGAGPQRPMVAKVTAPRFFLRRVARIWPLYAAATIGVVAIAYAIRVSGHPLGPDMQFHYGAQKTSLLWIAESLTFSQTTRPPILGIGWTLQFEFIFYSLFALAIAAKPKNPDVLWAGFLIFFICAGLATSLSAGLAFPPILLAWMSLISNPLMFEFVFGLLVYRIFITGYRSSFLGCGFIFIFAAMLFVATAAGFLTFLPVEYFRPITWGITATCVVWITLSLERRIPVVRWAVTLGDASYSLYLVHWIIVPILAIVWRHFGLNQSVPILIYAILGSGICVAASFAVNRIEAPVRGYLRKLV